MCCKIPLTKNKYALVSIEAFEKVKGYKWYVDSQGYAARSEHIKGSKPYRSKKIYMHREILNTSNHVDHINHDKLDNRSQNLRAATRSLNMRNRKSGNVGSTSKYQGVHRHNPSGKWAAQIRVDGKVVSLGLHSTQEEARDARIDYIVLKDLKGYGR